MCSPLIQFSGAKPWRRHAVPFTQCLRFHNFAEPESLTALRKTTFFDFFVTPRAENSGAGVLTIISKTDNNIPPCNEDFVSSRHPRWQAVQPVSALLQHFPVNSVGGDYHLLFERDRAARGRSLFVKKGTLVCSDSPFNPSRGKKRKRKKTRKGRSTEKKIDWLIDILKRTQELLCRLWRFLIIKREWISGFERYEDKDPKKQRKTSEENNRNKKDE